MASTEAARAEAFASQADRSRANAETFARQAIETAKIIRDTKALIDRALDTLAISHRWVGTQLEILAPDGEWVTGPDLRGERGYGVTGAEVDGSYHLILTYGDGTTQDVGDIRGPQGVAATVAVGTVTTLAAGSPATVTNVGTAQDAILNFGIPQGPVGTGNVNGPVSSIADRLAVFNGTTGKIIKDGGYLVSDLLNRANHTGTQAQSTVTNLTTDLAARLLLSGGTMTGALTLFADPSLAMHAATKQYVDGLLIGMGKRGRVRAATTANITISTGLVAGQVIDGVTLVNGDLVLVKNQTTASQNGIYVVSASPARSSEFDTWAEFPGALFGVAEGTTNDNTLWFCTSNDGGTLGTTAIAFTKFMVAGELLAANNLSDVANAATARANLGLAIGTNVQAFNALLAAIAALTPAAGYGIVGDGSTWTTQLLPTGVACFAALRVNSDGTVALTLGGGVTVTKGGTGGYTITHSGKSNVVAVATTQTNGPVRVVTSGTSTTVNTYSSSGTGADIAFSIALFG
ncbi:MAG: hypothetical protein J0I23_28540 [Rhizobiales bacterium]|nr:hypothetical protein [Hyphomicrobiales bacterium]